MKVAGDLCDPDIEKSINWITSVIAQKCHPPPLYDLAHFRAPDASGNKVRILAINVQPANVAIESENQNIVPRRPPRQSLNFSEKRAEISSIITKTEIFLTERLH